MTGFGEMILGRPLVMGQSRAMRHLCALIDKIAKSDVDVLITGETGTGKELVARAIHDLSPRNRGPFIAVNCAALPENLVESELFGYEKGAFSGALVAKAGKFEGAQGGTIVLDEIGDMPLLAQAKMLRVLQERELERLGATRPVKLEVRVIAATNKDLETAVREGSFRQDLLYRLKVMSLAVPPLRERPEDIPCLVDHFLAEYRKRNPSGARSISWHALNALNRYDYPGNVRELRNVIQHACTLAQPGQIEMEHLPPQVRKRPVTIAPFSARSPYEDNLMRALRSITIIRKQGKVKPWYSTMRFPIERIHQFLAATGGNEFSRAQFAIYLMERGLTSAHTDVTAGRYLKKLVAYGVLVHNGKKANRVRYRLSEESLRGHKVSDRSDADCLRDAQHEHVHGTRERSRQRRKA